MVAIRCRKLPACGNPGQSLDIKDEASNAAARRLNSCATAASQEAVLPLITVRQYRLKPRTGRRRRETRL